MRFTALCLVGILCTISQVQAQHIPDSLQDSTVANLSYVDTAATHIHLETTHWKFNPGHNPKWKEPGYDDSEWQVLSPHTDSLNAVKDSLWNGHGWFRLTFRVDSSFFEIPRLLDLDSFGAAEIYIDGRELDSYGNPALSPDQEVLPGIMPTLEPALGLDPSKEHVIAVRYSFHNYEKLKRLSYSGDIGMGISLIIYRTEVFRSDYKYDLKVNIAFFASLVVLLLITLLHLSFYYRFPDNKENLWVFLVTLHLALFAGLLLYDRVFEAKGVISLALDYVMSYAFFQFCCMTPITLSTILQTRKHQIWKYLSFAGLPITIIHLLFSKNTEGIYEQFVFLIPILVLVFVLIAGGIIIWDARKLKRDNYWIISVGYMTMPILLLGSLVLVMGIVFLGYEPDVLDQFMDYWFPVMGVLTLLSIPGSMSVYVGSMFFDLYGDLETQVTKRTRELNEKNKKLEEANEQIQQQRDEVMETHDNLKQALEDLQDTQDQLVQQEKLASLGQLAAGIAHEIKNPLNFVNNFSDLSVELVEEAREELSALSVQLPEIAGLLDNIEMNLRKINEHGDRADGIVRSMLQHSRGGDGERAPTDLNALVEEYVNLSFHGMRAGEDPINVDIDLELDESVGEVPLVAEDFSRVIINLCNNAFDAMREKLADNEGDYTPRLSVRTRGGDGAITLEVEDNGPGIPEEAREEILQPFYTTKEGAEGTGLGLSITHDIVKAHGGELEVDTRPGAYTRFTINLNINST